MVTETSNLNKKTNFIEEDIVVTPISLAAKKATQNYINIQKRVIIEDYDDTIFNKQPLHTLALGKVRRLKSLNTLSPQLIKTCRRLDLF